MADTDDIKSDAFDDEPVTEPDRPPILAANAPATTVLVDYHVKRTPSHEVAPLVISGASKVVIHSGLNRLGRAAWLSCAGHPGVKARLAAQSTAEGEARSPLAGTLTEIPRVPRRGDDLFALISRTWSAAGLDVIHAAEREVYGTKPRATVTLAIAEQRRRLAKRGGGA